jgi:hypothetical protein
LSGLVCDSVGGGGSEGGEVTMGTAVVAGAEGCEGAVTSCTKGGWVVSLSFIGRVLSLSLIV